MNLKADKEYLLVANMVDGDGSDFVQVKVVLMEVLVQMDQR